MAETVGFMKESKKPVEKMSLSELLEAKERQSKIISNKKFLQKLPDKGNKLIEAYEKIESQIKKIREEEAKLIDMFANMQLSQPKIDVDKMEWTGKVEICDVKKGGPRESNKSNPDENERDIVNILLTTNRNSKIIVDERIPSPSTGITQDKFYRKITEKVDHMTSVDKKFKPFRTLKHEKPVTIENRDNTSATPPISKYVNGVVSLHLEESLEKQFEAEEKLKELEQERAKAKFLTSDLYKKKPVFTPDSSEIHPDEEYEVYDEDALDDGKYIVITTDGDPTES